MSENLFGFLENGAVSCNGVISTEIPLIDNDYENLYNFMISFSTIELTDDAETIKHKLDEAVIEWNNLSFEDGE